MGLEEKLMGKMVMGKVEMCCAYCEAKMAYPDDFPNPLYSICHVCWPKWTASGDSGLLRKLARLLRGIP